MDAGAGKLSYEEDLVNMAHVLEDLAASGWRPKGAMSLPPADPNRDLSRPDETTGRAVGA